MNAIVIATISVAVIGLIIGILLVNVGRKFSVDVDPKEAAIRECLPGNNCGGCGFAGCDALAKAIADEEAPVSGCPVGGNSCAEKIGRIMGVDTSSNTRKTAFVKCSGDCAKASRKANYVGITDCQAAAGSGLTAKSCASGCYGFGSCVKACPFDAIHVISGVAVVDRDKCKSCGKCVAVCPKRLIELIPYSSEYAVACSNTEKGPAVKKACSAGCIGCKICEKQCQNDAVHVENNISKIDYSKCVSCGACAEKCPVKAIKQRF